jgi:hypothetical protein
MRDVDSPIAPNECSQHNGAQRAFDLSLRDRLARPPFPHGGGDPLSGLQVPGAAKQVRDRR